MSNDHTQPFPAPEGNAQPAPSYYNAPPPQGPPLADPTAPAPRKKMGKGKKWAIGGGAAVVVFGIIGATNQPSATPTAQPIAVAPSASDAGSIPTVDPSVQASTDAQAAKKAAADKAAAAQKAADDKKAAEEKAAADKAAAEQAAADAMTMGQKQAIAKAESYLEFQAFSRKGLIQQLTSDFEQFSKADATFAVDHIKVNWNEQAAAKAKSYLEFQAFSRAGLIRQLTSQFEGFTQAQALYGVKAAGL